MTMYLHLTGSTHCAGQQALRDVQAGKYELKPRDLFFVREKANPYDSNAVQVWWRNGDTDIKLGFIEKEQASSVADYIDRNQGVHVTGHAIYGTSDTFCGLYMTAEIGFSDSARQQYAGEQR